MVGAILTQNTNWRNVETAITNLKQAGALDADLLLAMPEEQLQVLIRPSGFFRQKATRLQQFCHFYRDYGREAGLKQQPDLRKRLLAQPGIGPETADSILLYALDQPSFVIDAYTRRLFTRLGLIDKGTSYAGMQHYFESQLPTDLKLYQEYHALIVEHAKRHCRTIPLCTACPLLPTCPSSITR